MTTLYNAKQVDPAVVTSDDVAAILAKFNVDTVRDAPNDFFQPGVTYSRGSDVFDCIAVGWLPAVPVALGYVPVNLGGERVWEFGFRTSRDWAREWVEVSPS